MRASENLNRVLSGESFASVVESEERYRALVENVQEGVGLLGPGEDAIVEY